MSIQLNARPPLSDEGFIRSNYSSKSRYSISFPSVSPHTRQEFKDEADINVIMRRYQSTGELPHLNLMAPQYLDVSGIDFHEQMAYVAGAKSMFEELPSRIRSQFDNDPASFVVFCSDERNRVALAEMGLLSPEATRAALSPPTPNPPISSPPKEGSRPSDAE